ncbi:MAG: hemerythrin domain-containing protein [Bradymonadaceae bacterium]|nr:hemerythrin domain-containing protein [Lujinxingiaceae bacterium]
MNHQSQQTIADEIHHSHSNLNRLLEEIEAHAVTLGIVREDRASILEELEQYTRQFGDEILGHMADEEANLFEWLAAHLAKSQQPQIARLLDQHRELEGLLEELAVAIGLCLERPDSDSRIRDVNDHVRLLKYAFFAHINQERLLLERVNIMER